MYSEKPQTHIPNNETKGQEWHHDLWLDLSNGYQIKGRMVDMLAKL